MAERRGTKALELWCRRVTEGYSGVKVDNMTTSWRDGLAFCALIHHFRPDLIDFPSLKKEDVFHNNELAFRTAESYLGIPALLDAEDMAQHAVPDRLSILTYLSQYYQHFASSGSSPSRIIVKRAPPKDSENLSVSPSSASPPTKMQNTGIGRRDPCTSCGHLVFLAQRLMVEGHLYHRTCFRCARCNAQLTLANCYQTEVDGQYCCETCPDEESNLVNCSQNYDLPSQLEKSSIPLTNIRSDEKLDSAKENKIIEKRIMEPEEPKSSSIAFNKFMSSHFNENISQESTLPSPVFVTSQLSNITSKVLNNNEKGNSSKTVSSVKCNDESISDENVKVLIPSEINKKTIFDVNKSDNNNINEVTVPSIKPIKHSNNFVKKTFNDKNSVVSESITCFNDKKMNSDIILSNNPKVSHLVSQDVSSKQLKIENKIKDVDKKSNVPINSTVDRREDAINKYDTTTSNNDDEKTNDASLVRTRMKFFETEDSKRDKCITESVDSKSTSIIKNDQLDNSEKKIFIKTISDKSNDDDKPSLETEYFTDINVISKIVCATMETDENESHSNDKKSEEDSINSIDMDEKCIEQDFTNVLIDNDIEYYDRPILQSSDNNINFETMPLDDITDKNVLVASEEMEYSINTETQINSENEKDFNLPKDSAATSVIIEDTDINLEINKKDLDLPKNDATSGILEDIRIDPESRETDLDIPKNNIISAISEDVQIHPEIKEKDLDLPKNNVISGISEDVQILPEIKEKDLDLPKNNAISGISEDVRIHSEIKEKDLSNDVPKKLYDNYKLDENPVNKNENVSKKVLPDIIYPDHLNPFSDDDDEVEEVQRKNSLNPFGSESDEDDAEKLAHVTSSERRKSGVKPPRPPPPNINKYNTMSSVIKKSTYDSSLNPFSSDDDDDEVQSSSKMSIPKYSEEKRSNTSLNDKYSSLTSYTSRRKKAPAPKPPELFDTPVPAPRKINISDNSESNLYNLSLTSTTSSSNLSLNSPLVHKRRPAPRPPTDHPAANSTPLNLEIRTTEGFNFGGDNVSSFSTPLRKKVEMFDSGISTSKKLISAAEFDNDPDISNSLECSNSITKDDANTKQENHSREEAPLVFSDKSTSGQWKRRKGPAPAIPLLQRSKPDPLIPLSEIRKELQLLEDQQRGLERQGVRLEEIIRERCEKNTINDIIPEPDPETDELVLQLFELVNEKNELFRRQAELMYIRRQQRLEVEYLDLEHQIRILMERPEKNKTDTDKAKEEQLILRLVEVVERRNEVVTNLESDRLREKDEDNCIRERMASHRAKLDEINSTSLLDLSSSNSKEKKKKKWQLKDKSKKNETEDPDIIPLKKDKKHKKWFK